MNPLSTGSSYVSGQEYRKKRSRRCYNYKYSTISHIEYLAGT